MASALSWAQKWGRDTEISRLIARHGGKPDGAEQHVAPKPDAPKRTAREAAEQAVALLQASNTTFFEKGGCAGCHHQLLSGILFGSAHERGLKLDEKLAREQLKTIIAIKQPSREPLLQRVAEGGAPEVNSLFLLALAAQGYSADALTDAVAHDIAGMQRPDGSWAPMAQRPPITYSRFSETAYAVRSLRLYASPGRKPEIDRRVSRARDWLLSATPEHTEDRAMQLLGLRWSDISQARLRQLAGPLIESQQPKGGWAQRASFPADAYATGQALYALNQAGVVSTTDPLFRRGVEYLLGTQYKDGSWYVRSRSVKFQPYFESGFPHGHDQWISAAGTTWAALALTLAAGTQPARASR